MKKTDIKIITKLRTNGRTSLTELSRNTKLPISTIHERLKKHKQTGLLKPIVLLDFEKVGFATRAHILLSATEKEKLFAHLRVSPNVNNLFRVNNGWNIIMECIFKDMHSLEDFVEELENNFNIQKKEVHYVLKELKREGFFTEDSLFA